MSGSILELIAFHNFIAIYAMVNKNIDLLQCILVYLSVVSAIKGRKYESGKRCHDFSYSNKTG